MLSDLDGYRLSRSSSRSHPDARCAPSVDLLCNHDRYGHTQGGTTLADYANEIRIGLTAGGSMPTRNVVLTPHQSGLVEELVNTGRYQNASEVLREGLRLVEQRERSDAAKLAALRAAVDVGRADLAAGRYVEIDDDELDGYLGERARSRRLA